MRRNTLGSLLLSTNLALLAHAQIRTPSEFLGRMPKPPTTTTDALQRCPRDNDTLVMQSLAELRSMEHAEQSQIEKDSIASGNAGKLPPVPSGEMKEYRSLQQEVESQRDSVVAQLERLRKRTYENLLATIRRIGEQLDSEIVRCPKVGAKGIFDSLCVEAAESKAASHRLSACDTFLGAVNAEWNPVLEPLQQSFMNREKRITRLYSTSKHVTLKLQLTRLRLESWQTLAPILKMIDEVTRLAAQFSR